MSCTADRIIIDVRRNDPDTPVPARAMAAAMITVRHQMMSGYEGGSGLVVSREVGYPYFWEVEETKIVGDVERRFSNLSPVFIDPD